ncbi:MAG: S46 family peptidase [Phycisphaerales bacterium]|nr:S46 family peptidase [Phycisphaerales bacterium]
MNRNCALVSLALVCAAGSALSRADEGMWLISNPPRETLKTKYNFEPTEDWLKHMQRSVVRVGMGGTGSIVSPDGLVMTNHHVGLGAIAKLSTKDNDLMKNGFYAPSREQELKCPDTEIRLLWDTQDVTDRVNGAVKAGMSTADAGAARRKLISQIEKECQGGPGFRCQVVTLYQGAKYHVYRYKVFNDVRLVFSPEEVVGSFGGDIDNFEFPRFSLDMTYFRLYEDGKPYKPEHFLSWSADGAKENEPVFVFGHPGRTRRLYTVDHLKFLRDVDLPDRMERLWRSEVKMQGFAGKNAENARIAQSGMRGISNGRKVYTGLLGGLQDPELMGKKINSESELRSFIDRDGANAREWGAAFEAVANAQRAYRDFYAEKATIDAVVAGSGLLSRAFEIVQLADELPKPSAERLREYADPALPSLYLRLYSSEPLYDALEIERITQALSLLAERLGGDHPIVVEALAGQSPRKRAQDCVWGTDLKDPAARKALVEAGAAAVSTSKDPMLVLAAAFDPRSRELRKLYEDKVESAERDAYAKIAQARFARSGESVYPDATSTLRMSFGTVRGVARDNTPAFTEIGGLFARAQERKGEAEFTLPAKWDAAKGKLDLKTPYNFTADCDIIGGNSGSPTVNAKGEVVGLIFDGNVYSLTGDVIYDGENGRSISVDSRGMIEALRKVYNAGALADELQHK